MSNNAYATLEGGEIGIAQAIQAEACGLRPVVEMNPILLKPTGDSRSQVVRLGKAGPHLNARDYYKTIEQNWDIVTTTLDGWKQNCDVLVMEGAGSPVELNILHKDIANLKPVRYVDGKWILVGDIERGGVFAQLIGTWNLMNPDDQSRGLGAIVNKFRGDPSLFDEASAYFHEHMSLPYLGLLPLREDLYIEDEDSLSIDQGKPANASLPYIAWIRYPRVSNTQDQLPWQDDAGIASRWVTTARELENASAIILPGSKDTLSDLKWLQDMGLANTIIEKAKNGVPVVGICGGYQMLGYTVFDSQNGSKKVQGLGLLPIETELTLNKKVVRRTAVYEDAHWETYEIHTGVSHPIRDITPSPLLKIKLDKQTAINEGIILGNVWGSYLHGLFDSECMRRRLLSECGMQSSKTSSESWLQKKNRIYKEMGTFFAEHVNTQSIESYLKL